MESTGSHHMNRPFVPNPLTIASERVTVIQPPTGWYSINPGEVWAYRDLLLLLAWRDISARFRQSLVGWGWAILKPLLSAIIYTLVFSVFVKIDTEVPYPIFAFAALIPWMYFSTALSGITSSVVGGGSLLTKVYFPRLILPLASVIVGLVELLLQLCVLAALMAWYHYVPGWPLLFLPVLILLTVLTALAFGIWMTALNVRFRDVGMAVPFLIQIWMYLCPIMYPITLVPEKWRTLYAMNPMVGVIEGFRWSLLGTEPPNWGILGISAIMLAVLLIAGLAYFRRIETTFADVI